MWSLLLRPTVILTIMLGLSVLANVGLWKLHSRDLIRIGQVTAERNQAQAAALECSKGVEELRKATAKKAREIAARLAAATARARVAERKVQETLQTKPTNPGNECASTLDMDRKKIRERRGN